MSRLEALRSDDLSAVPFRCHQNDTERTKDSALTTSLQRPCVNSCAHAKFTSQELQKPGLSLGTPATTSAALGTGKLSFSLKPPRAAAGTSSATSTTAASHQQHHQHRLCLESEASGAHQHRQQHSCHREHPGCPRGGGRAAGSSPIMTYAQLESLISKWSLELEDQERHFLQQATQVNAWDRTLIENSERIASLHRIF
ncbi:nuclear pore glycoprotein p62-like [Ochotona princeps]|uniref:nuclear pore glycoprotein p62-like n=1 Tax=Ochotona princeps TaxID=9978 RepID=UPI00271476F2|nr:nuclear pore glycoprotein p62-like [Ochotona princeps]